MTTLPQGVEIVAIFENINHHLAQGYLLVLLMAAGATLVYRMMLSTRKRSRLIGSLHGEAHRFFSIPTSNICQNVKYHLLYAPIFRASQGSYSSPMSLQALYLSILLATNAGLCFWDIPFGKPEALEVLRARSGTISLANMVPLYITTSVKNPLINLLNISFQNFNFMHRWFGRIVIVEAIFHAGCHLTTVVRRSGLAAFNKSMSTPLIYTGVVGMLAMIVILMQSLSIIRHTFYEAFLYLHIFLAITVLVFLWMHLDGFPQRRLLVVCMVLWGVYRLLRVGTLLYRSIGRRTCTATIEALPRDSVRISIAIPRPWTYKPGQYVYITIPSIGLWTAHPFSIAWSDAPELGLSRQSSLTSQITTNHDLEKAVEPTRPQTFSFVVRARDGFTKRLLAHTIKHAPAHLGHRVPVRALIEGPYGLATDLDSYGTILLIAGGVGITHHLGYIRHLIEGYSNRIVAARQVTLIWVIRREADKDCVGKWMNDILKLEGRKDVFRLEIWVTRGTVFESRSPSNSLIVRRGRPDLQHIVSREGDRRLGCMAVSACGPGGLVFNARKAVRRSIKDGRNIDFVKEAFGW
jgi:predicted ferric reductase